MNDNPIFCFFVSRSLDSAVVSLVSPLRLHAVGIPPTVVKPELELRQLLSVHRLVLNIAGLWCCSVQSRVAIGPQRQCLSHDTKSERSCSPRACMWLLACAPMIGDLLTIIARCCVSRMLHSIRSMTSARSTIISAFVVIQVRDLRVLTECVCQAEQR